MFVTFFVFSQIVNGMSIHAHKYLTREQMFCIEKETGIKYSQSIAKVATEFSAARTCTFL